MPVRFHKHNTPFQGASGTRIGGCRINHRYYDWKGNCRFRLGLEIDSRIVIFPGAAQDQQLPGCNCDVAGKSSRFNLPWQERGDRKGAKLERC